MKTLMIRKIRMGWELLFGERVITHKVSGNARGELLLVASGFILAAEELNVIIKVDDHLAFLLREKGLYKEKPLTANP